MALLASVILYECDDCKTVIALKEDDQWKTFECEWYPGLLLQFCPLCRKKDENQAAIRADQLAEQRFNENHKNLIRSYEEKSFGNIAAV